MDSKYIKAALSANFRFKKQCKWMATEVGKFSADFLAISKSGKDLIEVEVKVSKTDLANDFKKRKHMVYSDKRDKWTPNYFFFAVPPHLVEYAVASCVGKPYGVLEIIKADKRVVKKWPCSRSENHEALVKRIIKTYESVSDINVVEDSDNFHGKYLSFTCLEYIAWPDRVRLIKKASRLHERVPDRQIQLTLLSRLSSEMSRLRIDEQLKLS